MHVSETPQRIFACLGANTATVWQAPEGGIGRALRGRIFQRSVPDGLATGLKP